MTEQDLSKFSATNRKRDTHPARSARILTTGFSIAAVLGLTSGYSLAEANKTPKVDLTPEVSPNTMFLPTLQWLVAPASAIAPATTDTPVVAPAVESIITAPQPAVMTAPQVQPKVSRQIIQLQVSTTSSGSK